MATRTKTRAPIAARIEKIARAEVVQNPALIRDVAWRICKFANGSCPCEKASKTRVCTQPEALAKSIVMRAQNEGTRS